MKMNLDLRVQKTYLALHQAFDALSQERKFEDITVNELCEKAMIRRTTFYKHFADKYEYYAFYCAEVSETFSQRLPKDMQQNDIREYMVCMCREFLHFLQEHEKLVHNIYQSNALPVLLGILSNQIRKDTYQALRQHSGPDESKEETEGMAAFYAGGLINMLFYLFEHQKRIDEGVYEEIIRKFLPIS